MAYCKYCGKYISDGGSCDCDAAKKAGEVKEAAEVVKEKAEEASENVKEKAENVAESIKEKAADTAENIQKKAENIKNDAAEVVDKAKDKVGGVVSEARSDVAEAADKVKEKAEEAAKKTDSIAGDVAEKLPGNMKNKKSAVYVIAGIIAALVLILFIALCSGGGAKSTVKKYVKASYDKKGGKTMFSLTLPKAALKELKKDGDLEDMIDERNKMIEKMIDMLDGKETLPRFYKIISKDKMKNSELGKAETYLEQQCSRYGADDDDITVSKGYEMVVKTKCKDEDGDEKYEKSTICVVDVKGDGWKIIPKSVARLSTSE